MSKMKFSRAGGILKSRGFYAAAIICLVAFGAAAWFGFGRPNAVPDTARAESTVSVPYVPAPTISTADKNSSSAPSDSDSSSKQQQTSSKNTASVFLPSDVTAVQTVTPTASFFVMPLTGDIIKNYSDSELQYSLTFNDWRLHKAVDIKGVTGDRINSAGDGTVTAVTNDPLYGLTVEINHGNNVIASYSGLETADVKVGDVVSANMQIGTLGKVPCESVETTHLHFSMSVSDKTVSPLNMIGM